MNIFLMYNFCVKRQDHFEKKNKLLDIETFYNKIHLVSTKR